MKLSKNKLNFKKKKEKKDEGLLSMNNLSSSGSMALNP